MPIINTIGDKICNDDVAFANISPHNNWISAGDRAIHPRLKGNAINNTNWYDFCVKTLNSSYFLFFTKLEALGSMTVPIAVASNKRRWEICDAAE